MNKITKKDSRDTVLKKIEGVFFTILITVFFVCIAGILPAFCIYSFASLFVKVSVEQFIFTLLLLLFVNLYFINKKHVNFL